MATLNGDVKVETAESFAKDYLDDLFNNNKNLGAFEEETLDLNIKSKYDDIVVDEDEEQNNTETSSVSENIASYSLESSPVVESIPSADEPLEPGQTTLQVNGHASETSEVEVEVVAHNGDLESNIPEPGQVEFTEQSSSSEPAVIEQASQLNIQADEPLEPGNTAFQTTEEAEESDDIVAPIPMSRSKPAQTTEEEEEDAIAEMKFRGMGLSKNWWDSKHKESETTKERGQPVDKFRTIKQNIKRGNTRSLLERFENMSKVAE